MDDSERDWVGRLERRDTDGDSGEETLADGLKRRDSGEKTQTARLRRLQKRNP